ncbi:hypothetical protein AQUCO_00300162v1 [Aquilegia coerulea]|uniref:C2H2-type domain-containing protein n=1 Tax=Aquilegia coerulea TaxID=218851 RepID=A0A2G5EXH0_AQUCA|nr:hypothetical protein AQUCO_00300162v1 [Aquilegia coerulea]
MESDTPAASGLESLNQIICWTTEDHQGASYIRSYRCSFCKKGFSNAQALGGHMNIHRRDRAKLNLPASVDMNELSLNIIEASNDRPVDKEAELEFSEHIICTLNFPSDIPTEDGVVTNNDERSHTRELQQLPLFAETPKAGYDKNLHNQSSSLYEDGPMKSEVHVDLKLRLGPETQDTCTTTTKEFF